MCEKKLFYSEHNTGEGGQWCEKGHVFNTDIEIWITE